MFSIRGETASQGALQIFGGSLIVLLFGAPGSGKGTQSRFISERRKIPKISTGDMLREEGRKESVLGLAAKSILASGGLVDDGLVNAMVVKRLSQPDCHSGFILDGYPRTVPQAVFLSEFLKRRRLPDPKVIHLDVPIPVLVSRLSSRRHCSACGRIYNLHYQPPERAGRCDADGEPLIHREDDREEVVRARLEAYHRLCGPLIEYYRGPNYHRIDGQCAPEKISAEIKTIITARSLRRAAHARGGRRVVFPYPATST
jgi:adenylate kinase